MPANALPYVSTGEHGQQGTRIDPHVKNGVGTVFAWIIGFVKGTQKARHIGFKVPIAQNDDRQRQEKNGLIAFKPRNALHPQGNVSNGHQCSTNDDRLAETKKTVSNHATYHWE